MMFLLGLVTALLVLAVLKLNALEDAETREDRRARVLVRLQSDFRSRTPAA